MHSTKNVYANTKHGILSLLCSLFSALGIVVKVLLERKLIVQDLWHQNIDWDQDISKELASRIEIWKRYEI